MNKLLDQIYRIYKCNASPLDEGELLEVQSQYILKQLSLLLYTTYASTNNDLIPKFRSSEDVLSKLRITSGVSTTRDGFSAAFIRVRAVNNLAPTQMCVFVKRNDVHGLQRNKGLEFDARVLIKSSLSNQLFTQILESIPQMSEPLIIRRLDVASHHITNVLNALSEKALALCDNSAYKPDDTFLDSVFGTLDLAYTVPLSNDSLRSIQISVPSTDTGKLLRSSLGPIAVSLHEWLSKTTRMRFERLAMKSVVSGIVHLSDDGKIKLCNNNSVSYQLHSMNQKEGPSDSADDADLYVLFLLEGVYLGLIASV